MLICLQIEVEPKLALKEDEANGKTAVTEEQVAGIVGGGMCLLVMPCMRNWEEMLNRVSGTAPYFFYSISPAQLNTVQRKLNSGCFPVSPH